MMPPIPTGWLYRILGVALAASALLWLAHSRDHWRERARANAELLRDEKAAHAATVAGYRAAAEQARREDAANLARVKVEQATINERTANDFESRIASARADAARLSGRLRPHTAAAAGDPGAGGAAAVPAIPVAAGTAPQAAHEDGLSLGDRQLATEQAIQLDELIKWVRRQEIVRGDGVPGGQAAVPQDSVR
jgi:hypothetical protein